MSTAHSPLVADRYRLVKPLGQGGMGRVWKARDEVLHRDVAIKELVPPPGLTADERREMRERSLREARAIARLNHINVVRIFDVLRTDADPWIVMEYVPSRSLQDVITNDGPVPPVRAARIGLGVLGALRAAHRSGVLHRDVKPANVLLGEDGRVVLTDFGLATVPGDPTVTRTGLVLGSPAYIAPERARTGDAGPAADMWSLGATLYAAVEGRSPYARPSAIATLAALATEPPPPAKNAGPLKPVLNGLLRKDPTTRINGEEAERLLLRAAGKRRVTKSLLDGVRRPSGIGRPRGVVVPGQRPPADVSGVAPVSPPPIAALVAPPPLTPPKRDPAPPSPKRDPAPPRQEGAAGPADDGNDSVPERDSISDPHLAESNSTMDRDSDRDAAADRDSDAHRDAAEDGDAGAAATALAATRLDAASDTDDAEREADEAKDTEDGATAGERERGAAQATTRVDDAERAPADSAPTDSAPTDSAPTDSAPGDSASADSAPGRPSGPSPTRVDGAAVQASPPVARATAAVPGASPARPAGVSLLSGRRGRWLLAALAALLVIVVAVVALSGGDDDGSKAPGTAGATPSAAGSAAAGGPAPTPTASPSRPAQSTPPASPTGPAVAGGFVLPPGWKMYRDGTGFSVPIRQGWQVSRDAGGRVQFRDPRGGRMLMIDQTDSPQPDPVADWKSKEDYRRSTEPNYQRVGQIRAVDYGIKAADWEWLYTGPDGTRMHVRNRGFIAAKDKAYAIYWETPESSWAESLADYEVIAAGFKPVRGKAA